MLYETTGNLVQDKSINVFCHQTNCRGKMGAGIAKEIAETFPIVAIKDREHCANPSRALLGTNLYVPVSQKRTCVNMYAQFNFGRDKCYTEYDKLQMCLNKLANKLNISNPKLRVGFPAGMSCGNAGGKWDIVKPMLEDFASKVKQEVYIVTLNSNTAGMYKVFANFIGNSVNIQNKWHNITIQVLPKSYLVKCGNAVKYYFSEEALWSEWLCYEEIHLPKMSLGR